MGCVHRLLELVPVQDASWSIPEHRKLTKDWSGHFCEILAKFRKTSIKSDAKMMNLTEKSEILQNLENFL